VLIVSRATLTVVTAALVAVLPSGAGGARAQTLQPRPSLASLVAQARQLSDEIDSLGQQIDGLRIELSQARSEARLAERAVARDRKAVIESRDLVAALAAQGYMDMGSDPALELLMSGDPGAFLTEEATLAELDNNAGLRYTALHAAQVSAERASATAEQQIAQATALQTELNSKTAAIRQKVAAINSSVMTQAMTVFDQTGQYPDVALPLSGTLGAMALRYALSRRGDPYVWGAAGPGQFDCSGLVVWAFSQEGVALPHYTGSLWDSGMHVSRANLRPGDLVFFFADISHVGMYAGNGLMVDAPTYGQPVQVQPINWNSYVGAVRVP
jgi:cell wall-associated NlpC family hydrolase